MTTIDTTPEAIAALLDGVTPGPWGWQVSRVSKSVELSGGRQSKAGGDLTVMSFERWGFNSAAPVFWTWEGNYATSVDRADALAVSEEGRDHHKDWFARIDHPDARFIAAARELVPALAAEIARLTAERDEQEKLAQHYKFCWNVQLERANAAEAERDEARAQVAALLNRKAIGDPSQNSGYDLAVLVFDAGDDGDPWLTYRSGEGWRLHRKEEPK